MSSHLVKNLAVAGLLLGGLALHAQDWRYQDPGYYRGDYRAGDPNMREPLDRVWADLDRATRDMYYLSGGEMRRMNHAREEMSEFQRKWERGHYDKGELNDVIGSIQKVVDHNRLQPRDRDMLVGDLYRLRDFRARFQRY